jgi:hypothetical protein
MPKWICHKLCERSLGPESKILRNDFRNSQTSHQNPLSTRDSRVDSLESEEDERFDFENDCATIMNMAFYMVEMP